MELLFDRSVLKLLCLIYLKVKKTGEYCSETASFLTAQLVKTYVIITEISKTFAFDLFMIYLPDLEKGTPRDVISLGVFHSS